MNRPYSLAIFCVFGLIVGCVGLSKRDPGPVVINQQSVERLYGMEWQLRSITVDGNNVVMHVDAEMTLRFDADGQVHGYGAVNRFSGGYRFDSAGALAWSAPGFVVAKKAGPPELLEKERIFLDALKHSNRAILGKRSLILQTDDGNTVITFLKPGVLLGGNKCCGSRLWSAIHSMQRYSMTLNCSTSQKEIPFALSGSKGERRIWPTN